jgi:glycosyltransferase involved in cell wall biosynthesis
MKILFTFFVASGGMETLNRERCLALQKLGIECHLLYERKGSGLQNNTSGIPTFVTTDPSEIKHLIDTHQYDAIIVASNYMTLQHIRNADYRGPLVFECQGLGTVEQATGTLLEALPFVHSFSNAILLPQTDHMIKLIESIYPGFQIFSFHNLLNTDTFCFRTVTPPEYPIIGWVGRIEKNKNWREFLQMAEAWTQHTPNLKVWLFEDPNIYEEGERRAFEQVLSQQNHLNVKRFSNVPHHEMPTYYSMIGDSGGFLCSTSIQEGFGYALLEAMSCRCPVLSSDSGGPRNFIIPEVTGKMYPVLDPAKGIQQGTELLSNSKLREKSRNKARAYVVSHFSPDIYCKHFLSMLSQLGVPNTRS